MRMRRKAAIYVKTAAPQDVSCDSQWSPPIPLQPPKIMDEVGLRPHIRRGKMPSPSRIPTTPAISVYELLQIARLSTIRVSVPAMTRRSSWEADGPIPGLGIRVSVLGMRFSHSIRPLMRGDSSFGAPSATTGSAFSPVVDNTSKPSNQFMPTLTPLAIVIDEVLPSGELYFEKGQFIVEANGVNLLSPAASSRHSLLLRFMQLVLDSREIGLNFVMATPDPRLVHRVNRDFIEVQFL